jgi:hypothetical protein
MIFLLGLVLLFVVLSIYFFFRAENMQRDLITIKSETARTSKKIKC